jgi:hypothetical protein
MFLLNQLYIICIHDSYGARVRRFEEASKFHQEFYWDVHRML